MQVKLRINEKKVELDEFLDEEEMELSPFHFSLIELSQYVNGYIDIVFSEAEKITLDLFSDFSVCFDDIVDCIKSAKLSSKKKETIWFCEQGSDFYLDYEVEGDIMVLSFRKGKGVGMINKNVSDFTVEVNKSEYIHHWMKIFEELARLFEAKLNRKNALPF
ncbi:MULTISPECIES: hypothetical protein [unclassified Serratia (in: enterobacteria)]|uniref:hypothetical protein n=1 Tax=unclassified Serratia (in: enterobacteria) TaxID=2647522 RepID=UPI0004685688|nr:MULTISPECIES: hypothetical protein [unclassified Serratia (in: enterobacteria)]